MRTQFLAQGNRALGYLPSVNLTYKLKERNSLNFATQQRFGVLNSIDRLQHRYILSDYSMLYAHKIGVTSKFSIGSLIRFRDGEWLARAIEQIVFFSSYNQFKFSHRFRLDHTTGNIGITNRLRYRMGIQIPLSGAVLDSKEAYIKLNNELLNILIDGAYSAEYRCSPNYGYVVSDQLKLEFGLDYRLSNLTEGSKDQNLWFLIGGYYKLN